MGPLPHLPVSRVLTLSLHRSLLYTLSSCMSWDYFRIFVDLSIGFTRIVSGYVSHYFIYYRISGYNTRRTQWARTWLFPVPSWVLSTLALDQLTKTSLSLSGYNLNCRIRYVESELYLALNIYNPYCFLLIALGIGTYQLLCVCFEPWAFIFNSYGLWNVCFSMNYVLASLHCLEIGFTILRSSTRPKNR